MLFAVDLLHLVGSTIGDDAVFVSFAAVETRAKACRHRIMHARRQIDAEIDKYGIYLLFVFVRLLFAVDDELGWIAYYCVFCWSMVCW